MASEDVEKAVISYLGITSSYLTNPNFTRLKNDMKRFVNKARSIKIGSVDVFGYISNLHQQKLISLDDEIMLLKTLEMFRDGNIDNNTFARNVIVGAQLLLKKLRRHLGTLLIVTIPKLTISNLPTISSKLYSYSKRKKYNLDFMKYYKMSRGGR